jgi:bifunctional non-homologous end joining protein LigD
METQMIIREPNPSKSDDTRTYETVLDTATGATSCNCRGWTTKREGQPRDCTHTKAIRIKHAGLLPRAGRVAVAVAVTEAPAVRRAAVVTRVAAAAMATELEPMLASAMTRGQRVESFGADWAMEEKFDGHRLIVTKRGGAVTARSRVGNGRALPPHIAAVLARLPDGVYDGELVVPGGRSSDVARLENASRLVLVLFDAVEVLGTSLVGEPYTRRREVLLLAAALGGDTAAVRVAASVPVSRAAVEAIWARGGEGVVLKRLASVYQPGYRSADWVKVKKGGHVTVTVTGFETGDTGIAFGKTCVRDDAGRAFTVKTLNNATIREVSARPEAFVGRRLVLKFNEQLASGAYRHPMFDHWAGDAE